MIKIFRGGAGVVTPLKPLPPTNNFCLYPPPVLRGFWKDPLMTPHHPTSSTFHCYPPPHPQPLPPLKILIMHMVFQEKTSTIIDNFHSRARFLSYILLCFTGHPPPPSPPPPKKMYLSVSVNSKPDHSLPGQTLENVFEWANSTLPRHEENAKP